MKTLRYRIEALGLGLLMMLFRILPSSRASALGGWLGRMIGPRLGVTRRAHAHLGKALPNLSDPDQTIIDMWDHLGRVIGEYPHLESLSRDVKVVGGDILRTALKNEHGAIFFGGHIGNWELNAATVLTQFGVAPDLTYRAPNNPYVDKMLMDLRSVGGKISGHAKSSKGGKSLMKALKQGQAAGILIDQKYNEGVNIPFFGMDAMTNPAAVQLAQKFKCTLIPIRSERLDCTSFRLTIYEPLPVFEDDGQPRPVETVLKDAHALMEGWIAERPAQWLWLHNRWKDE